jgi:hypothetical protein
MQIIPIFSEYPCQVRLTIGWVDHGMKNLSLEIYFGSLDWELLSEMHIEFELCVFVVSISNEYNAIPC